MTGLETLSLFSNQLTALPESIVELAIYELDLDDNPQLIRSAQSAAVQAWLQDIRLQERHDSDDDAW